MDLLAVTLLELIAEALSVDMDESEAEVLAEEVGVDVSEGDILGWIEEETAAEDEILADEDVLDVDDKLGSMEDVTDLVICNDEEISGVALPLSDIKDDLLANEDLDADTDALSDLVAYDELDNVAILVEVIDVSGDAEEEEDTETVCDSTASRLVVGIDKDETLGLDDIEGELDNNGVFEVETEEIGEEITVTEAVAETEDG